MTLDKKGAKLLFRVLTERVETNSIAIASNASFSEWTNTFTDPRLCAAIVDRFTFGGNIIETGTTSYQLAHTRPSLTLARISRSSRDAGRTRSLPMKRLVVIAAAAGVATFLAGAGQAQAAAPADPVTALKKQFSPGRGVRVTETTTSTITGITGAITSRTTGVIGFGKSSAVDYDLVSKTKLTDRQKADAKLSQDYEPPIIHAVRVGRSTYVQGFTWGTAPEGKSWIRFSGNSHWGSDGQRGSQFVDVLNPAILQKVITKAAVAKAGEYRGTLTFHNGYPSDPDKISFRLLVNRDQLPVRLITEYTVKTKLPNEDGKLVKSTEHSIIDTRYSDWGIKVTVAKPPAREIVDFDDLDWPPIDQGPISVTDRIQVAPLPKS